MIKARNFILRWEQDKNDEYIKNFTEVLRNKVKFIWYDTDTQAPIEVFTRLNIDKMPLTGSVSLSVSEASSFKPVDLR